MNALKTETQNREWVLDGLRGAAALVVVVEHYLKHFYPVATVDYAVAGQGRAWWEYLALPPLNLFSNGAAAVSLFFVLSGYVLALSAFRQGREYPISRRLVARYLRLAIPVTASLLLLYLYSVTVGYDGAELMAFTGSIERRPDIASLSVYSVLTTGLVGSIFFMGHSLNAPLWTITYEAIGSCLIMVFCWSSAKMALSPLARAVAYAIAIACLFDTFLIGFALGAALADAKQSGWLSKSLPKPASIVLLAAGLLMLAFSLRGLHSSPYAPLLQDSMSAFTKYTVNAIGATLILLFVVCRPVSPAPQTPSTLHQTAVWLGALSFPIYLVHYPLISVAGAKVFFATYTAIGMFDPSPWLGSLRYWASSSLAIFVSFFITVVVASLFSSYIDTPTIEASRRISAN